MLNNGYRSVRYALRSLSRTPALSLAAVVCLALGIGATTSIFSAIHAALLRRLPFTDSDQLVTVYRTTPTFDTGPFSAPNYADLRRSTRSLTALAAIAEGETLIEGTGDSERITAYRVSGEFFEMLGTGSLEGRLLRPQDEQLSGPDVVVLGEELWRRRFGGDPLLIGQPVLVGGVPREVVGVVPRGFRVPYGGRMIASQVWLPLRLDPNVQSGRRNNFLRVIGKRRSDISVEGADTELRGVMRGIIEAFPELRGEQLRVVPLEADAREGLREPLLLLFGAVGLVLLIAVANVASLLLARGVAREREIAIRVAMGAGRSQVIGAAMVESGVLAGVGTLIGLGLAYAGIRLIGGMAASRLPQLSDVGLHGGVLAFAIALAVVVAFACGFIPAWRGANVDPEAILRTGSRGGQDRGTNRFLKGLVMAEVGLSLVLLLSAGLVLRGFSNLIRRDPGFDPKPLLTVTANISAARYPDQPTTSAFLEPALDAVRSLPGVVEVGGIHLIPYQNWGWSWNVRYEGQDAIDPTTLPLVENRYVSPSLFGVLQQRLVAGRLLTDDDTRPDAPYVVVVNEALVARDLKGEEPIGKRFHLGDTSLGTIVGVISDIRNYGPDRAPRPEMYWAYGRWETRATSFPLLIRTTGDPETLARPVIEAIRSVDPSAAVSNVASMPDIIAESVTRPRFYLSLLGIFAGVAVILAVAGLYGMTNYLVARRTRELAVRTALGSSPSQTLALVMRQGLLLVGTGLGGGLAAGFFLTGLLERLLYGVSPTDPVTWVLVSLLLVAVAGVALVPPARRAARVDPIDAMRAE